MAPKGAKRNKPPLVTRQKKNKHQKKYYYKYKPGDLVELTRLKSLDHNGMEAVVVGPIIKNETRKDGRYDRYPVKILDDEPTRVRNVKPYNMILLEINSRKWRKLKESVEAMQMTGADDEATGAAGEAKEDGKAMDVTETAAEGIATKLATEGTAIEVARAAREEKRAAKPTARRSRKRKRGELDKDSDDEDDGDPRPRKKFQLTFSKILSDIYTTFSTFELARLSRHTIDCRSCHVEYPIAWAKKEKKFFNIRLLNDRNGPRKCLVCQTRHGHGLAYLLFARMCRIDPTFVKRQEDFIEQELYWNVDKLCDEFEKKWKEIQALDL